MTFVMCSSSGSPISSAPLRKSSRGTARANALSFIRLMTDDGLEVQHALRRPHERGRDDEPAHLVAGEQRPLELRLARHAGVVGVRQNRARHPLGIAAGPSGSRRRERDGSRGRDTSRSRSRGSSATKPQASSSSPHAARIRARRPRRRADACAGSRSATCSVTSAQARSRDNDRVCHGWAGLYTDRDWSPRLDRSGRGSISAGNDGVRHGHAGLDREDRHSCVTGLRDDVLRSSRSAGSRPPAPAGSTNSAASTSEPAAARRRARCTDSRSSTK